MIKAVKIIESELERCIDMAREQGWTGDASEYCDELTAEDCEWIANAVTEEIGRMPTEDEWEDAGIPHMNPVYCRDEDEESES